jgi:chromate reductase, NAD(P)H dehydrogenase (quinone)
MPNKKNILAIVGSASNNSTNLRLVEKIKDLISQDFNVTIFDNLKTLPHFDPELSINNPPKEVVEFRSKIEQADGIIICTPEYIFSIPSGLKNAIEWCISTTVFTDKPVGLITASANGNKGHEELQLIMKTAMAKFTEESTLLISGVKGKFDEDGNLNDLDTQNKLDNFISAFVKFVNREK